MWLKRCLKWNATQSSLTTFLLPFGYFEILETGVKAAGTVRVLRTGAAIQHLKLNKDLKQEGRGAYDFISGGHVSFIRWSGNSIATIGSNCMCHEPVGKMKRRVKGGRKEVGIPVVVSEYNSGMGGVDLLDRLCGSYRPTIYSKKRWWSLFTHALNVSVVAAWRLCQLLNPKITPVVSISAEK